MSRLENVQTSYLVQRRTELDALEKRLLSLNPENIMKRGFAFVRHGEKLVGSAAELKEGDRINIRFFDGEKSARVD